MADLTLSCFGAVQLQRHGERHGAEHRGEPGDVPAGDRGGDPGEDFGEDFGGETVRLHGRKTLALLVYLVLEGALEEERPHPRSELAALFWPALPEGRARGNLRVALARLQHGLGPDSDLLLRRRHEVRFRHRAGFHCDATELLRIDRITRRHRHPSRHACATCRPLLRRAAALQRGDFLAGFALSGCDDFDAWQLGQREHLRLRFHELLTDLADACEAGGDLGAAERYARRLLELEPLHEAGQRQLMRLLAAQGRPDAALTQFERCRELLRRELGVEPDERTRALRRELQAGAAVPAPEAGDAPAGGREAPRALARRAPAAPLTSFVGRERDAALLASLLQAGERRLICLTGAGGCGKTRLARQLLAQRPPRFRDGGLFVPLAELASAAALPGALLARLESPAPADADPWSEALRLLAPRRLLLLLDGAEHLASGAAGWLELLREAPGVTLLVTSRVRLNLQAETVVRLQGLEGPEAERLFVDRARQLQPDFAPVGRQRDAVARICRLLEGAPLALELAATRIADESPEEIAALLETGPEAVALLAADLGDLAPRHRSLVRSFEHSWLLLSRAEREALTHLAALRGGFSAATAERLVGVAPALLAQLRDASLLQALGAGRYRLLEPLRSWAALKRREPPAGAPALRAAN